MTSAGKASSIDPLQHILERICGIFNVPFAQITLKDQNRIFVKSKIGLDNEMSDQGIVFCKHAINSIGHTQEKKLQEIHNLSRDPRFSDNALVENKPYIDFYLGYIISPMISCDVGVVSMLSTEMREPTKEQVTLLGEFCCIIEIILDNDFTYSTINKDYAFRSFSELIINYDKIYYSIHLLESELKKVNITFNEWLILNTIQHHDNVTSSFIAKRVGISSPLITIYIKKLESKSLIKKTQLDYDRRSNRLSLSDDGLNVWRYALQISKTLDSR